MGRLAMVAMDHDAAAIGGLGSPHAPEATMRRVLALILPLFMAACDQGGPTIYPTRDVAVTYRNGAPGSGQAGGELAMYWSAGRRLMRMQDITAIVALGENQGRRMNSTYWVIDPRNRRAFRVMVGSRIESQDEPFENAFSPLAHLENARFTRVGPFRTLGLDCTIWDYQTATAPGRACFTEDGVMLGDTYGRATIEARSVAYGPQDPALFERRGSAADPWNGGTPNR
jgi:hypothetical protein